jgi:CRP-like cAMP-binding protein
MSLPNRNEHQPIYALSESFRDFVPLNSLDRTRREELARQAKVVNLQAGCKVFSCIDTSKHLIYLLDGEVELRTSNQTVFIESNTDDAAMPLNAHAPHRCTAITETNSTLVYIDRNLVDILFAWDTTAGYSVQDITESDTDSDDWMSVILRSNLVHKIPPVNIQRLLTRLEPARVRAGDILFKEGDEGQDFYFIQAGQIEVIRAKPGQGDLVVAKLGPGDSFGEEALLSNQNRNATIRCVMDATLLRLSRADFDELLKTPVVQHISFTHAHFLHQKGAVWLDVRQQEEQQEVKIKNALTIPLGKLRSSISQLDSDATYIAICNNGQRSACAAYLLNAYGINAFVLDNGLKK